MSHIWDCNGACNGACKPVIYGTVTLSTCPLIKRARAPSLVTLQAPIHLKLYWQPLRAVCDIAVAPNNMSELFLLFPPLGKPSEFRGPRVGRYGYAITAVMHGGSCSPLAALAHGECMKCGIC